ncbi:4'-phosphopantetheinyl transferase family protein [Streptomyces violascens]|uniref:4'-phosphopantetheinyl transferase family protein n=1 Tax=Streptomyces violascens TaxID=67381 RepID=UPI003667D9BA
MIVTSVAGRLLEGVLPPEIALEELFADPRVELFPEEAELVAAADVKRQKEFATVRFCARRALERLGFEPGPIVPAADGPSWAGRAPRWPDGVVGSMTHCEGYRAAAVARGGATASIGVDAEPNMPLPANIVDAVMLPEEQDTVARLSVLHPEVAWDRLMFSAKESVFKAWYPLTRRWLDFLECVINPDPDLGTLTGTLRVPGPVVAGVRRDRFDGVWRTSTGPGNGLLATAVVVAARSAAGAEGMPMGWESGR